MGKNNFFAGQPPTLRRSFSGGVPLGRRHQDAGKNNKRNQEYDDDANFNMHQPPVRTKAVKLEGRNQSQKNYIKQLNNDQLRVLFAVGPAGTGKTMMAVLKAIDLYNNGDIKKIVITRPSVGVGKEDHGFLPGTLNEKMEPWLIPIYDVFLEHFSPRQLEYFIENKILDVTPFMYMRGRTFKDCFIIADEVQNTTPEQMKLLLTRLGEGSKIVLTGDLNQRDRKFEVNGLSDFIDRLVVKTPSIDVCYFQRSDIVRDPIVREILEIYGDED